MTVKNHILTTANIYLGSSIFLLPIQQFDMTQQNLFNLSLVGLFLGAIFPDIDESNSFILRWLRFSLPLKHRTITHNILVYLLTMIVVYYIDINIGLTIFVLGFGLGAILHILEDSVTNSGVNWALKPILNKFALLPKRFRFNTNSNFENFILFPLNLLIIFVLNYAYLILTL